ncbi:hypothetical protein [Azospirillum tabaci]|uniref:hypothetical protein n=1 Tax=Azospirillum tabaci TaxID=2752310 RepID=UPI001660509F|nr:hypothetical protein [Azospirillum tabaci]
MLMTEEEARTKWCPMARVAIQNVASDMAVLTGSSPIHPVGNRATLIAGRARQCDTATGSRCIGSECMAWRWVGDANLWVSETCPTCNGKGTVPFASGGYEDCTTCDGDGRVNGRFEPNPKRVGFCGAFGKPEA